jgi:cyanophycinase
MPTSPITRRTFTGASMALACCARNATATESVATPLELPRATGPLLLYGGGKPQTVEVQDRFWSMAGGAKARIVVIPTAHEQMDSPTTAPLRWQLLKSPWEKRGVAALRMLHTLKRQEANEETFLAALQEASGVWLGGGDQRRLLNTFRNTRLHEMLLTFSQRGGIIGGSSAGTAVQSDWAILTNDAGEVALERGFNFLTGAIVDQHFLARERQARLRAAVLEHPELVGLGIDEFTALVVEGDTLEVVGKSVVTVYRANDNGTNIIENTLVPGQRYNRAFAAIA